MLMEKARLDLVAYGKRMFRDGLVTLTSGNISICDAESGLMAITPSGIPYEETKPEDIVIMTLDGKIIEGFRKPSSEYALHAAVYLARKDAGAVVHTHSTYATVLGITGEKLRAVHFLLANMTGGCEVPLVPYFTYGTQELAEGVKKAMASCPACLLQNHGMVASGRDIEQAYLTATVAEQTAELQYRAECIGTPRVLTEKEAEETYESYARHYGQKQES